MSAAACGVIGTSVSSPEFVGALALFVQQLGKKNHRLGNANYYLYARARSDRPAAPSAGALQFYHLNNPATTARATTPTPAATTTISSATAALDVRKLFGMTTTRRPACRRRRPIRKPIVSR